MMFQRKISGYFGACLNKEAMIFESASCMQGKAKANQQMHLLTKNKLPI